eukprot:Partr_v1_DN27253_c2_g1_i1_m38432 putative DNA damage-responsive transcriptional repressor
MRISCRILLSQSLLIITASWNAYTGKICRFVIQFTVLICKLKTMQISLCSSQRHSPGSLFEENMTVWNVARLDNLLNDIGKAIPGVNTPYLYFGMYKSTFAWHLEDMDLYSINYIHFGAPKQWFVIPPEHHERFARFAQSLYPESYSTCSEFIRHKTFQISTSKIQEQGIPVYRCVQEEGEFILTFPYGYHSGYNVGYNCAESINFALERWIDIGKKAKSCKCVNDSVKIDVEGIFGNYVEDMKRKRFKPCSLCGQEADDLLPVFNRNEAGELLATKKFSHELCALAVPECRVVDGKVEDFDRIPKSRFSLRCKFCQLNVGACIQCSKEKCFTSYHPKCAADNGIQLDIYDGEGLQLAETFCLRHSCKPDVVGSADRRNTVIEELDSDNNKEVWTKFNDGMSYQGLVVADYREKGMCKVEFAEGYFKAVAYEDILFEKI